MHEKPFEPIKIGALELKSRLAVPAMSTLAATPGGASTEQFIACHEREARGGWGPVITEHYDGGKPFSFFHADPPMIEGGALTVLHFPYVVDGKVEGIMEINVESVLAEDGRCAYERKYEK